MEEHKIEYFVASHQSLGTFVNKNNTFNNNNDDDDNNCIIRFEQFSDLEGLPFPLYYGYEWRLLIATFMITALVKGLHYRAIIFKFLCSNNDYTKPINKLILLDQMNGLLLAFGVATRAIAIISPVALAQLFGSDFCRWISLPVSVYMVGKITWSFLIALMRVIYIKAQNWLTNTIGEKKLLLAFMICGTALTFSFGSLLMIYDNKNVVRKLCSHLSDDDVEILQEFSGHKSSRKAIISLSAVIGGLLTTIELVSYITMFHHIAYHDNNIAVAILKQSVIDKRNRSNAISFFGLFITWSMDILYIIFSGFVFTIYNSEWLREIVSTLKNIEIVLVPWIQISTTPCLIQFIKNQNEQSIKID